MLMLQHLCQHLYCQNLLAQYLHPHQDLVLRRTNKSRSLTKIAHQILTREQSDDCPDQPLRTSLRGFTKISVAASTNVQSAPTKYHVIPRFGHAAPAGQYSTSAALKSGLRTKEPEWHRTEMRTRMLQDSGDVLAAIYRRIHSPATIPAGVRKRLTQR
jgi:hypothetical protein